MSVGDADDGDGRLPSHNFVNASLTNSVKGFGQRPQGILPQTRPEGRWAAVQYGVHIDFSRCSPEEGESRPGENESRSGGVESESGEDETRSKDIEPELEASRVILEKTRLGLQLLKPILEELRTSVTPWLPS